MVVKSLIFLFLLCSTAYSQQKWERNWQTDSLRGAVSAIAAHNEVLYPSEILSSRSSTTYSPTGQAIQYTHDRDVTSYCYDAAGRLSCTASKWGDDYYIYDQEGKYRGIRSVNGNRQGFNLYTYDGKGRLVESQSKHLHSDCVAIIHMRYDDEGRVISVFQAPGTSSDGCMDLHGGPALAYHHSTPDSCIETPLAVDCSCARISVTRGDSPGDKAHRGESCYGGDGKIRWERSSYRYDKTYYPLMEEFSSFDEKGRATIVINKGVIFSDEGIHYPSGFNCPNRNASFCDTTKWLAVFPAYNQHDNYIGEEIYVYNTLEDLKNRAGTLKRKRTITYIHDAHGNWVHQSIHENGVLKSRETRIITYFPEASNQEKQQDEDLR